MHEIAVHGFTVCWWQVQGATGATGAAPFCRSRDRFPCLSSTPGYLNHTTVDPVVSV